MHGLTGRDPGPLQMWFEADTLRQGVRLSAALRARGWTAAAMRPACGAEPRGRSWSVVATPPVPASAEVRCREREMEELAQWFPGCRFVGSEPV